VAGVDEDVEMRSRAALREAGRLRREAQILRGLLAG
jgi:hypothetical protein